MFGGGLATPAFQGQAMVVGATLVAVTLLGQTVDARTVTGSLAVAAGFTLVSRRTLRRVVVTARGGGESVTAGEEPEREG